MNPLLRAANAFGSHAFPSSIPLKSVRGEEPEPDASSTEVRDPGRGSVLLSTVLWVLHSLSTCSVSMRSKHKRLMVFHSLETSRSGVCVSAIEAVCAENPIRVDAVTESPKLAE